MAETTDLDWLPLALPKSYRVDASARFDGARIRLDYTDPRGARRALLVEAGDAPALLNVLGLRFWFPEDGTDDSASRATVCRAVSGHLAKRRHEELRDALQRRATALMPVPTAPEMEPPTRTTIEFSEGEQTVGLRLTRARFEAAVGAIELVLLLATECGQSCAFCVLPLLRAEGRLVQPDDQFIDALPELFDDLVRRGDCRVVIEGADALEHPRILELLDELVARPTIEVDLRGPLRRIGDPKVFSRLSQLRTLTAELTVLSADPAVHDRIAGRPGSHARVLENLSLLREREIPVHVSVVVVALNLAGLPALIRSFAGRVRVAITLYHPEHVVGANGGEWTRLDLPNLLVSGDEFRRVVATLAGSDLTQVVAYDVPACWLPTEVRDHLFTPRPFPSELHTHVSDCEGCAHRRVCPGVSLAAARHPERLHLLPEAGDSVPGPDSP